jgi:hypothetical protein
MVCFSRSNQCPFGTAFHEIRDTLKKALVVISTPCLHLSNTSFISKQEPVARFSLLLLLSRQTSLEIQRISPQSPEKGENLLIAQWVSFLKAYVSQSFKGSSLVRENTPQFVWNNPQPNMVLEREPQLAFKDSMIHKFCNSHYLSHFATFFIDTRAKRSTVDSCIFVILVCTTTAKIRAVSKYHSAFANRSTSWYSSNHRDWFFG